MNIPAGISVPRCVEQGSIYHYNLEIKNNDGSIYSGDRFFIVLNVNPLTDTVLVMTTMTTRIQKQERYIKAIGASPNSLVKITKDDFPYLTAETAINCNNTYEISLSELVKKIEQGGKIFFEKLPKSVMDAIISAVVQSSLVSTEHKKMII